MTSVPVPYYKYNLEREVIARGVLSAVVAPIQALIQCHAWWVTRELQKAAVAVPIVKAGKDRLKRVCGGFNSEPCTSASSNVLYSY